MPKSKLLLLFPALFTFNFGDGDVAIDPPSDSAFTKIPDELIPDKWKDHFSDLRRENKSLRERLTTSSTQSKEDMDKAIDSIKASSDLNISELSKSANDRVLRAELKASALKAGMVDLDGLKLADLSKVKLNDAGEVEGADALMEELKKAKPYLFGATKTTSSDVKPPARKDNEPKKATDMTKEEYAAERQKIARGIFPTVV